MNPENSPTMPYALAARLLDKSEDALRKQAARGELPTAPDARGKQQPVASVVYDKRAELLDRLGAVERSDASIDTAERIAELESEVRRLKRHIQGVYAQAQAQAEARAAMEQSDLVARTLLMDQFLPDDVRALEDQ